MMCFVDFFSKGNCYLSPSTSSLFSLLDCLHVVDALEIVLNRSFNEIFNYTSFIVGLQGTHTHTKRIVREETNAKMEICRVCFYREIFLFFDDWGRKRIAMKTIKYTFRVFWFDTKRRKREKRPEGGAVNWPSKISIIPAEIDREFSLSSLLAYVQCIYWYNTLLRRGISFTTYLFFMRISLSRRLLLRPPLVLSYFSLANTNVCC